jgi:O-antigen ligase
MGWYIMNLSWKVNESFSILIIFIYLGIINLEYIYRAIPSVIGLRSLMIYLCTILFVLAMLRLIVIRRNIIITKRMFYFLFLVIFMFVSLKNITPATEYGEQKFIEFIFNIYVALMVSFLFYSKKEIKNYYKYLLIFDLVILALMLVFNEISTLSMGRITVGDVNPIWLARFLGEIIILLLFIMNKKIFLILRYMLISILIIGIIFTGSKGPLFCLILAISIEKILHHKKRVSMQKFLKKYFRILFWVLCLFIFIKEIILKLFAVDYLAERFIISDSESYYGEYSRFNLFKIAFNYFTTHPLLGNGIGSFGYLFSGYDIRLYPHNIILEVISELGILGFLLLIIPILGTFLKVYKYSRKEVDDYIKITTILLIYYFINSLISGDIGLSNMRVFLYIGLINHLYVLNKNEHNFVRGSSIQNKPMEYV